MKNIKTKFIVFEGIDGSGKTTQIKKLHDFLIKKGIKAVMTREHQMSGVGLLIDDVLNKRIKIDPLALEICFVADRCDHTNNFIKPKLKEENVVICDRYYWSTVAYSENKYRDWMLKINKDIGIMPDVTIFVDTSPKVAIERIGKGRNIKTIFEKQKSLERIRKNYLWLEKNDNLKVIRVDGDKKVEEIYEEILAKLGYGQNF